MSQSAARIGGGFLALAAIWIGVYWAWEPSQKTQVSFASETTSPTLPTARAPDQPTVPFPDTDQQTQRNDAIATNNPAEPSSESTSKTEGTIYTTPQKRPFTEYTVKRNDTYESISKKMYGTIRYARSIMAANPYISPTSLRPGRVILIPVDPNNAQGAKQGDNTTDVSTNEPAYIEYTVVKGDTLSELAQRFYGSMRYADVIYQANRDTLSNMNDLHLGQTLRIPSKQTVVQSDSNGNQ